MAAEVSSAWSMSGAATNWTARRFPTVIVPVLSRIRTSRSPAASTARPDFAMMFARATRLIPEIPMAGRRAPIVVGIRQTKRAIKVPTSMAMKPTLRTRKMKETMMMNRAMVSAARNTRSASSFGVDSRTVPSTRRIRRSRND